MKKRLTNCAAAIAVSSALLLQGCSTATTIYPVPKSQVWWQDSAKNECVTTKVKPDWYTAEENTNCFRDGKATEVTTTHTDVGMISTLVTAVTGGAAGGAAAGAIP